MMLDEIDKMDGYSGRSSRRCLKSSIRTEFDVSRQLPWRAVDLSRVAFIATANMLDTIPGPLLDAWRS